MRGGLRHRRWRFLPLIGWALYALFLVTAPFAHHDIACHLKTPFHCTSCSSNLIGSNPGTPTSLGTGHLADAGRAVAIHVLAAGVLLPVLSTGRSPPAHF